ARREAIWTRYDGGFVDLPLVCPAPVEVGSRHARHLYTVLVDPERCGMARSVLVEALAARGIATSRHFKALHLHTFYAERFGLRRGQFPHAERISDQTVSLPLFPTMTSDEVDTVIARLRDIVLRHDRVGP
ncbi:MAG: DegT/DnrJ/EryC1/StrS family aminotransferase, partial [Vicinamibacterales bacterium]|nr:DegT/DnrJ/EryC1/StrS family aminotransferase [Vicinamibacterales bacterium]